MQELSLAEATQVGGGKDCTFNSLAYSKGAVIKMDDEKLYQCTGNEYGEWSEKK